MSNANTIAASFRQAGVWVKRRVTAPLRARPDFIIIGAQKAGTTSLYEYLARHPHVSPALEKEVHYFDLHASRSEGWYRSHFPREAELQSEQPRRTGEASPDYLYHPLAAERMHSVVPDARLIVLLRDPVERAYSHYHHERNRNREPLPTFEQAIRAEPQRLAVNADYEGRDAEVYSRAHRRHSYVDRGRYAPQLRRYFEHYPRDQVLVLYSEAMFADPQATYDRVLEHLDLPPFELENVSAKNVGDYEKRDIPLERALRSEFEAPNRDLSELLGAPTPW